VPAEKGGARVIAAPVQRCITVRELARRYRVGRGKVAGWIQSGQLKAINTSDLRCGRPRWLVTPEALAEWERGRVATTPPMPRKQRRAVGAVDFYAD
jgi:transposase